MQIITFKSNSIEYPVGYHIKDNHYIIKSMVKCFINSLRNSRWLRHDLFKINIICTGSSGSIIGTYFNIQLIKLKYDCRLIYVGKTNEKRHQSTIDLDIFFNHMAINVIVDDFIVSGNTMKSIYENLGNIPIHYLCVTGEYYSKYRVTLPFEPEILITNIIS